MSMPRRVLAWLLPLGAALVLLAGCSMPSPPASTSSPQPSVSPVCAAADAFAEALTGFKDTLKPGVTLEQIRSARDQVVKTYDDLVSETGGAAQARVDAVRAAKEKFTAAVNDIPNNATLTAAIDSLRDEAANVQAALSDLTTEAQC
ncbi:hypothetical protein [uncultured Arthrobacter sp.]|uniref:hypothetical protein n=1 Tax=uncultured Arthrobacter sp. TaxID=114050 RepID=UPI003217AA86